MRALSPRWSATRTCTPRDHALHRISARLTEDGRRFARRYVERAFSEETASLLGERAALWVTNEFQHSGLKDAPKEVAAARRPSRGPYYVVQSCSTSARRTDDDGHFFRTGLREAAGHEQR